MAAAPVEPKIVFSAQLDKMGLADLKPKFVAKGWETMADFAFAYSGFKEPDPVAFHKEILVPLLGEEDSPLAPKIRRLFSACYFAAAADMEMD